MTQEQWLEMLLLKSLCGELKVFRKMLCGTGNILAGFAHSSYSPHGWEWPVSQPRAIRGPGDIYQANFKLLTRIMSAEENQKLSWDQWKCVCLLGPGWEHRTRFFRWQGIAKATNRWVVLSTELLLADKNPVSCPSCSWYSKVESCRSSDMSEAVFLRVYEEGWF